MEYQVLARKWRPKSFSDMVGQEHITKTLQNALLSQKTAHAYLFVGPRGIGKTSIARIFAKALNCKEAPVAEPCCRCESCISIADGSNIDIIEIDGASNNSVNDIRNLRDEVLYMPVKNRYKVYIVDEVHMLSSSAWNALLKTLEEPPAHVKFLFATTEVHKILPTVLSRCQRFDLRRISEKLIVNRLKQIVESENVKISKFALNAIARAADGGLRDALSLLDQIIAFHLSEEAQEISEEQILNTFGLAAPEKIYNIVKAIIIDNKKDVIEGIHHQTLQGKNLEKLFEEVLIYLRGIEICQIIDNPDSVLEAGEDIILKYKELSKLADFSVIQRLLEVLSSSGRMLHDAINKQVYIETLFLKAMRHSRAKKVEDLINKFNQMKTADIQQLQKPQKTDKLNSQEKKNNLEYCEKENKNIAVPQKIDFNKKSSNDIPDAVKTETAAAEEKPILQEKNSLKKKNIEEQPEKTLLKDSPESLWHKLILDMEHINQPQLKYYLQDGKPKNIENNTLIVSYDEEFGTVPADIVSEELKVLNKCLSRITGIHNFNLRIVREKGISPPPENLKKDLEDVKKKIENNQFVNETIKVFNGRIVDYRG